jgi:hypothetical protein
MRTGGPGGRGHDVIGVGGGEQHKSRQDHGEDPACQHLALQPVAAMPDRLKPMVSGITGELKPRQARRVIPPWPGPDVGTPRR